MGEKLERTKKILEERRKPSLQKKRVFIPIIITVAVALICIYLFIMSMTYKTTDNAFIVGTASQVAPKVSGHLKVVYVGDNQYVKDGELVAEIDPSDYIVRVHQCEARLAEAKAKLNVNQKTIEESMSNYDFAQKDYDRYNSMYKEGIASRQEYDKSLTSYTNARTQVDASKNIKISTEAEIKRLEAELEAAKLDLSYTKLYSPQNGKVTCRALEKGNYVQVGQQLMVIETNQMWVVANYKENQVTNMREGQPVKIKIDTFPGKVFKGHIDSIQRATGASASLFPPENAVGSYVKIVQRIPVKILFDEDYSKYMIAPGMSVVPTVKVK